MNSLVFARLRGTTEEEEVCLEWKKFLRKDLSWGEISLFIDIFVFQSQEVTWLPEAWKSFHKRWLLVDASVDSACQFSSWLLIHVLDIIELVRYADILSAASVNSARLQGCALPNFQDFQLLCCFWWHGHLGLVTRQCFVLGVMTFVDCKRRWCSCEDDVAFAPSMWLQGALTTASTTWARSATRRRWFVLAARQQLKRREVKLRS